MRTTFETTLSFIRYIAHAGIVDKGGVPYWQHPVRVAMNIGKLFPGYAQDEEILMAALLHDVMEDTEYEYADLAKMGYTERTLNICQWLDKNSIRYQNMTYLDKIRYMAAHASPQKSGFCRMCGTPFIRTGVSAASHARGRRAAQSRLR